MPNPHTATQPGLDTPNKQTRYEVTRDDLPVHCPMPGASLWNSHPQVYMPVEAHGPAKGRHCGAEYVRKD